MGAREEDRPKGLGSRLQQDGAMVDEHGRPPGVASRTGTGSSQPPADPERMRTLQEDRAEDDRT
ncbi:hypothetical protein [Streptomyces sp. NPDC051211]|uniref:hypothetical protein n=1 Tax=Streptomyces sp. NPDC051211 TaxID=3154643 RepID=UPI00344B21B4